MVIPPTDSALSSPTTRERLDIKAQGRTSGCLELHEEKNKEGPDMTNGGFFSARQEEPSSEVSIHARRAVNLSPSGRPREWPLGSSDPMETLSLHACVLSCTHTYVTFSIPKFGHRQMGYSSVSFGPELDQLPLSIPVDASLDDRPGDCRQAAHVRCSVTA